MNNMTALLDRTIHDDDGDGDDFEILSPTEET
jgi:hypothetical protein